MKDGGPAFPCEIGAGSEPSSHQTGHTTAQQYGMSLRDYFAAAALRGLVEALSTPPKGEFGVNICPDLGETAKSSYEYADAMLAERDKETK